MADPDWTDPCAVLDWLRPQYYKSITEGTVVVIRHGDEWTHYGPTDAAKIQSLMLQLENQCARKKGLSRRRAITAG